MKYGVQISIYYVLAFLLRIGTVNAQTHRISRIAVSLFILAVSETYYQFLFCLSRKTSITSGITLNVTIEWKIRERTTTRPFCKAYKKVLTQ